jgi:uncharacterized caspase-like protein
MSRAIVRSLVGTLSAALLLVLSLTQTTVAQKRFALVIGNFSYASTLGPLSTPAKDIVLVEKALLQVKFDVVTKSDATRIDVYREIDRLGIKLGDAGEGAIGFLYYSGHGVANSIDHLNYLIPKDAGDPANEEFWYRSVPLNDVVNRLAALRQRPLYLSFSTHAAMSSVCPSKQ